MAAPFMPWISKARYRDDPGCRFEPWTMPSGFSPTKNRKHVVLESVVLAPIFAKNLLDISRLGHKGEPRDRWRGRPARTYFHPRPPPIRDAASQRVDCRYWP